MNFKLDLTDLNIKFDLGNMRVKLIDCGHGVFLTPFPRHMHSFYEMHYICAGEGSVVTDDGEYPLQNNSFFITAPQKSHAQNTNPGNPMEEYFCSFEITKLNKDFHEDFFSLFDETDLRVGESFTDMKPLFSMIENEAFHKNFGYVYFIESLIRQIILYSVRNLSQNIPAGVGELNTLDDRRTLIIDHAFIYSYKNITLPALSEMLGLSERQTARYIKQQYEKNFLELRTQARLNAAFDLLKNKNDLSVEQVAEQVGFSNCIYFSKLFKNMFGMPPSMLSR